MPTETAELTFKDIEADVLKQVRGMEPGTYASQGNLLKITLADGYYVVKLTLSYRSWTFIYTPAEFEIKKSVI